MMICIHNAIVYVSLLSFNPLCFPLRFHQVLMLLCYAMRISQLYHISVGFVQTIARFVVHQTWGPGFEIEGQGDVLGEYIRVGGPRPGQRTMASGCVGVGVRTLCYGLLGILSFVVEVYILLRLSFLFPHFLCYYHPSVQYTIFIPTTPSCCLASALQLLN